MYKLSWEAYPFYCLFCIVLVMFKVAKEFKEGLECMRVFRTILMSTKLKIIPTFSDIFFSINKPGFQLGFIFCQNAFKMFIFRTLCASLDIMK